MSVIETIETTHLNIPLSTPYHLSHTTLKAFDVIVVKLRLENGRTGFGEMTPLSGYSDESVAEALTLICDVAPRLVAQDVDTARATLEDEMDRYPFSRAAIDCALETTTRPSIDTLTAPIVGILSTNVRANESIDRLASQVAAGFETIKVKIGFEPERDARRLSRIVEAAPSHVTFRVDANQGYTLSETRRFLEAAPRNRLQHIEQPLPVGNLEACRSIEQAFDLPVMLDEEIAGSEDLRNAHQTGAASRVKFKLMKAGGWRHTVSLIEEAESYGFKVVLGNGVQSDLACVHEATIWSETGLTLAGEFNGWQKQENSLINGRLTFADGHLRWAGGELSLSPNSLAPHVVEHRRFSGQ